MKSARLGRFTNFREHLKLKPIPYDDVGDNNDDDTHVCTSELYVGKRRECFYNFKH